MEMSQFAIKFGTHLQNPIGRAVTGHLNGWRQLLGACRGLGTRPVK